MNTTLCVHDPLCPRPNTPTTRCCVHDPMCPLYAGSHKSTVTPRFALPHFALSHLASCQIAPCQFAPMVTLNSISPRVISRYTMQSQTALRTFNCDQAIENMNLNFILKASEAISPNHLALTPTLRGMYLKIPTRALLSRMKASLSVSLRLLNTDHNPLLQE